MLRVYLFALLAVFQLHLLAQKRFIPDSAYKKDVLQADSFYKLKKYLQSALMYDALLQKTNGFATDRYNAACSWALAGNKNKAFQYLNVIATTSEIKFYNHLVDDSDLITLHADKRWLVLLKACKLTEDNVEKKLDKYLLAVLDTIYKTDQETRFVLHEMRLSADTTKKQKLDSLNRQLKHHDSVNLTKVKNIIYKRGWLGYDEVGDQGNLTLFLVIQHSDSATQAAYLPKMKAAFKNGKARGAHLALLEDRVLVSQANPQLYGSQVRIKATGAKYEFYPIENVKQVNARRTAMDLEPIEDYAKRFKIEYVLPK